MSAPKKSSNRTKLHDDSLMPFGVHKNKRLGDVPDSYFKWFLQQSWAKDWPDLYAYAKLVEDSES
jgi:hypothetical protein